MLQNLQTWMLNFRLKWLLKKKRMVNFTIRTYLLFGVYDGAFTLDGMNPLHVPVNFSLQFKYKTTEIDAWIHKYEFNGYSTNYSFVAKCAEDFQRRVMFDPVRHYSIEEILERIRDECLVLKIPASFIKTLLSIPPIQFTSTFLTVQEILSYFQTLDSEPRYYVIHNTLFKMGIEE